MGLIYMWKKNMGLSKCSVDANVLLDWLLDRDHERTKSIEKLFNESVNIGIADITIMELAYVLERVYKLPRKLVIENISRVINDNLFNCNRNLFRLALPLYEIRPALSFADCCVAFYAQLTDSQPLYTFDKKLAHQSEGLAKLLK